MFKKTPENGREKVNGVVRALPADGAISIIGPGMHVDGDINTEGTVRIEGSVRGTIRAAKAVVLGKGGVVVGDVITQDAVIGGRLNGSVLAESRLELQSTCDVEGEIRTRAEHLHLEEGARFNGQIQMLDGDEPVRAAAPPRVREVPEEPETEEPDAEEEEENEEQEQALPRPRA